MDHSLEKLLQMVNEKVQYGEELALRLQEIQDIDGVPKLHKKLIQEIDFLKGLEESKEIKLAQIMCSNLQHIGGMVECATRAGTVAVCKKFPIDDFDKLSVDIVCDKGNTWMKVIARNPKALTALTLGQANYGTRTVLHQAKDYLKCAKLNPHMYRTPKVVFEFFSGVEKSVAEKLIAKGVSVRGDVLPDTTHDIIEESSESSDDDSLNDSLPTSEELSQCTVLSAELELNTVNLDVTAMMAYVSNMTNGHCNFVFKQQALTQQAAWEAERPVKPILQKLFEGKTLVCCRTAWDSFENIVNTLGGDMEKQRTAQLKEQLTIYEDNYGGDDDLSRKNLRVKGHVRERSKIVFNFGQRIKALTVTANEGFVRAAEQQGITYAAFVHESRALTEGKEATAISKTSL